MHKITKQSCLLLHGFMSTADSYFLPDLTTKLLANGLHIFAPSCPNPEAPQLSEWISCVTKTLGKQRHLEMIIAHSLGGLLALQLLSQNMIQADRLFMIGASFGPKENMAMNTFLNPPLNIEQIKRNTQKIYTAFSFDDPWTAPEYGILKVKQLDAVGIVYNTQGHFECSQLPQELYRLIF